MIAPRAPRARRGAPGDLGSNAIGRWWARQRVLAEGRGAFVAAHPSKDLVQVEWKGEGGREHVAFVSSEVPEALAEQIRRASAAAKAGRVRIAEHADDAGEPDGAANEEAVSEGTPREGTPRQRER